MRLAVTMRKTTCDDRKTGQAHTYQITKEVRSPTTTLAKRTSNTGQCHFDIQFITKLSRRSGRFWVVPINNKKEVAVPNNHRILATTTSYEQGQCFLTKGRPIQLIKSCETTNELIQDHNPIQPDLNSTLLL